jgi:predicted transcriptional regulator YheO
MMEVSSAINSGLQGFQNASQLAEKSAADIATNTVTTNNVDDLSTSNQNRLNNNSQQELPELNQSIVNLKVAEYQAKSSSQVIKSADDALGTLLDVTA